MVTNFTTLGCAVTEEDEVMADVFCGIRFPCVTFRPQFGAPKMMRPGVDVPLAPP